MISEEKPDVIINEEKKISSARLKIEKEKQFLEKMDKIEKLDNYFVDISKEFNEGLTNLAYLRFKNESFSYSITSNSYQISSSFRQLKENENKFEIIENLNNEFILNERESDDEDETDTFISKENELKEKLNLNEKILMKFGNENRDPVLYKVQENFINCLKSLIELKNYKETLKIYIFFLYILIF